MPFDSTPQSFTGFRLATITTFLPIRSSGLYHAAMPDTTCLPPKPSSSCKQRSFLDFFTFSQSLTRATLRSTFAKSSMVISSAIGAGSNPSSAFSSGSALLPIILLSSSISLSTSILGKMISPLWTVTSAGSTPNLPAFSYVMSLSAAPICSHTFGIVVGIKLLRSVDTILIVSSRL